MAQLEYNLLMDIASEGLLADCGFKNVLSPRAFLDIPIGRGVVKVTGEDMAVRLPGQNMSVVTLDADLVTGNDIDITLNGSALATVSFDTDHLTTMQAIVDLLEAQDAVKTATISGADDRVITIQADEGFTVTVNDFDVTGGASQATATIDNVTEDEFYGVALRIQNKENLNDSDGTVGPAPYREGDAVSMLTRGRVYVKVEDAVTSDSDVFMRFVQGSSTENPGQFRSDNAGGDAIAVPDSRWIFGAEAGGLAVLEINMP